MRTSSVLVLDSGPVIPACREMAWDAGHGLAAWWDVPPGLLAGRIVFTAEVAGQGISMGTAGPWQVPEGKTLVLRFRRGINLGPKLGVWARTPDGIWVCRRTWWDRLASPGTPQPGS